MYTWTQPRQFLGISSALCDYFWLLVDKPLVIRYNFVKEADPIRSLRVSGSTVVAVPRMGVLYERLILACTLP